MSVMKVGFINDQVANEWTVSNCCSKCSCICPSEDVEKVRSWKCRLRGDVVRQDKEWHLRVEHRSPQKGIAEVIMSASRFRTRKGVFSDKHLPLGRSFEVPGTKCGIAVSKVRTLPMGPNLSMHKRGVSHIFTITSPGVTRTRS